MADKKGLFVFRSVWASRIPVRRTSLQGEDKEELGPSTLESGEANSSWVHIETHVALAGTFSTSNKKLWCSLWLRLG